MSMPTAACRSVLRGWYSGDLCQGSSAIMRGGPLSDVRGGGIVGHGAVVMARMAP